MDVFMSAKSLQSCPALCHPMDFSLPDFSAHGIFQVRNTGVGSHFLLQGIFPTQGLNLSLLQFLQCQVGSLPLSHLGRWATVLQFSSLSHV